MPSCWARENLQKLPQLAAIHYNNCMYIAHHLLTLGHQFRYLTSTVLSDCGGTFVDMVPDFKKLGNFPPFPLETCSWITWELTLAVAAEWFHGGVAAHSVLAVDWYFWTGGIFRFRKFWLFETHISLS